MTNKTITHKIQTLNPDKRKKGVRIDQSKYVIIHASIEECLKGAGELTFKQLTQCVGIQLRKEDIGSVKWYVEIVKLDMEARNIIIRVPGSRPARYRLAHL